MSSFLSVSGLTFLIKIRSPLLKAPVRALRSIVIESDSTISGALPNTIGNLVGLTAPLITITILTTIIGKNIAINIIPIMVCLDIFLLFIFALPLSFFYMRQIITVLAVILYHFFRQKASECLIIRYENVFVALN